MDYTAKDLLLDTVCFEDKFKRTDIEPIADKIIAEEREACAKECDDWADAHGYREVNHIDAGLHRFNSAAMAAKALADAIRKRVSNERTTI